MKSLLKPLAIAALSLAMLTHAVAVDSESSGLATFIGNIPGCRNFDDAVEVSKLDNPHAPPNSREAVNFVNAIGSEKKLSATSQPRRSAIATSSTTNALCRS